MARLAREGAPASAKRGPRARHSARRTLPLDDMLHWPPSTHTRARAQAQAHTSQREEEHLRAEASASQPAVVVVVVVVVAAKEASTSWKFEQGRLTNQRPTVPLGARPFLFVAGSVFSLVRCQP